MGADEAWKEDPANAHLLKAANNAIEREVTRAPKHCLEQVELLHSLETALQGANPGASKEIIEIMEEWNEPKRILPRVCHRIYYNALLHLQLYDKFFIVSSKMERFVRQYPFGETIRNMMNNIAWPRFQSFLSSCLEKDPRHPWETSRKLAAALTVVNICYNSEEVDIAPYLRVEIPKVITSAIEELKLAFTEMVRHPNYEAKGVSGQHDVVREAEQALRQINHIRDHRKSESPYLEDHTNRLVEFLHSVRRQYNQVQE